MVTADRRGAIRIAGRRLATVVAVLARRIDDRVATDRNFGQGQPEILDLAVERQAGRRADTRRFGTDSTPGDRRTAHLAGRRRPGQSDVRAPPRPTDRSLGVFFRRIETAVLVPVDVTADGGEHRRVGGAIGSVGVVGDLHGDAERGEIRGPIGAHQSIVGGIRVGIRRGLAIGFVAPRIAEGEPAIWSAVAARFRL